MGLKVPGGILHRKEAHVFSLAGREALGGGETADVSAETNRSCFSF